MAQRGETSVWYRRPFPGFDITDPAVFALESFTIDGVEMPFHRQVDEVSQIYVVDLGQELIQRNQPVTVAFRFRTTASRDAHTFHLSIDRPTRDLDVELHYDSDVVAAMELLDFASRGDGGRVSEEPEHAIVRYRYDGWLFPRAGLVFAWTLQGERQAVGSSSEATHAHMQQTSDQPPTSRTSTTDNDTWGAWCFSDWGSFSSRESTGWIPCQQRDTPRSSRSRLCVKSSRRNAPSPRSPRRMTLCPRR